MNAGRFIARTLESVQAQTYGVVEHIVVDGGSADDTAAVVSRFGSSRLIVAPGLAQAAAVNRGVAESQGEIIAILNADDILYPDAIERLVAALAADPDAPVAYGDGIHIDENDRMIDRYATRDFDADAFLESCYICQPATAIRRSAFTAVGGMDPRLEVALDYDLWIRLAALGQPFRRIDGILAASRMHRTNKTLGRRGDVFAEAIRVLRAHYGYVPYTWSYAYANWLLYHKDGFFEQAPKTKTVVLGSLVLGLILNPAHPVRSFRDWYGHRTIGRR